MGEIGRTNKRSFLPHTKTPSPGDGDSALRALRLFGSGIQDAHTQCVRHLTQGFQRFRAVGLVDVDNDVADIGIGLQVLRGNVDVRFAEDAVDLGQYARHVGMDVQQAVAIRVCRQSDFWEVDRRQCRTVIGIGDQFFGHFQTDVFLGFHRGTTDMRCQDHVVETAQRGFKCFFVALRLDREHVNGCAQQVAAFQGFFKRLDVNDGTARSIDQNGILLHLGQFVAADHPLCLRCFRNVQADDVGFGQQFIKTFDLMSITEVKLSDDVVIDDVHAKRFGQHGKLGTDAAVADEAKGFAAYFMGFCSGLIPLAAVGAGVLLGNAAGEADGFCQYQLGNGACVGIRRVEDGNPAFQCGREINLIGTDAETADGVELFCCFKCCIIQLGAGTDTDKMSVTQFFVESFSTQGCRQVFDVGVASTLEVLYC
ncbi:methenyl tetrahydrofolate cyclo hydrolase [Zymobacter palmae]|uniref:Methenyl tetrahydrofolate cyclo hydrolase n=1 Tax=Zymobacter palmae TaxID=33074 RepID=A0A348HBH9_9GAMM|nr:methenyl tetrahydrofolate cyclo hydrolase [Zymobacter palmae]